VHGARLPRWRAIIAGGVSVMRASRLRGWITRRPRCHGDAEVAALAAAATNAFPPYVEQA
jgi:hypothetical protein